MEKIDEKVHYENMQRFVSLANEMIKSGIPSHTVSAAIMTASGVIATHATLGSNGTLNAKGIDAISDRYKKQLEVVQKRRQAAHIQKAEQQLRQTVDEIVSFPEDN